MAELLAAGRGGILCAPIPDESSPADDPGSSLPSPRRCRASRSSSAMIAALMALTALSIDVMLPALPQIRAEFGLDRPQPPAAGDHQLRRRLRARPAVPRARSATGSGASRCCWSGSRSMPLASFACMRRRQLRDAADRPRRAGHRQRRAAGGRDRGGARRLRRAADGGGDVLRDDGLHRRAGAGAERGRGVPDLRQLAPDLRGARSRSRSPSLAWTSLRLPETRPAASRRAAVGRLAGRGLRRRRRPTGRRSATRWRPA